MPNAVRPSKSNQCSPVLETHRIPLEDIEHTGRTLSTVLMLVRAISIEKSVPETFLFGAPSFHFNLRTRLISLLPAPFNASYEGDAGMCHMLNVKGATMWTTRNRLLQFFEILPPGWWQAIHGWPPCKADKKDRRALIVS